jgi:hypothetical protein
MMCNHMQKKAGVDEGSERAMPVCAYVTCKKRKVFCCGGLLSLDRVPFNG